MSMLDLSEFIQFDFIFEMLSGIAIGLLDFKAVPYLLQEITGMYRSLSERIVYLIFAILLVLAPLCLWYHAYSNSPFYEIYPLNFFDFCIWLIVGVPVLLFLMHLHAISERR